MKIHSVKFNFIMNFIMSASSIVFPLITFPYISRVLMATGNGKVATASAVITYFNMFASLGIPTYGIRACAKVRKIVKNSAGIIDHQFNYDVFNLYRFRSYSSVSAGVCSRKRIIYYKRNRNGSKHVCYHMAI